MKNPLPLVVIFSCTILLVSCRASRKTVVTRPAPSRTVVVVQQPQQPQTQSLPPGQAKKIYGSKSAKPFAPGQQKKQGVYPLIIVRTPSIFIYTFSDGRRYHRNDEGMIYWLGKDDRFYLDDAHISKIKYDDRDYKEWNEKKHYAEKGKDKEVANSSNEKQHAEKGKDKEDANSSKEKQNADKGKDKDKEEANNSKEKQKGKKDSNSATPGDDNKAKESKNKKGG